VLDGTSGGNSLAFLAGTWTPSGTTYSVKVAAGQADGTYALTLTGLTDLAGNTQPITLAKTATVRTTPPSLVVGQTQVTYFRSPFGNAVDEVFGPFTLPHGPYFGIAPADPLTATDRVPAAAFVLGSGLAPSLVRFWSDGAKSTLLGSAVANGDGTWPRTQLAAADLVTVYASGLDDAGNDSPPMKLQNVEWVGSTNKVSGSSAASLVGSTYLEPPLVPVASATRSTGIGAEGIDRAALLADAEASWRQRVASSAAPVNTVSCPLVYDASRGRVVRFGGGIGDTWEWDGFSWVNRTPVGARPSNRRGHALVYDAARNRVLLFGGTDAQSQVDLGDTWEWDGQAWTNLTPALTLSPSARAYPAFAYDAARARVVLVGGGTAGVPFSPADTWEWDGKVWANRTPASGNITTRLGAAAAYDVARSRVVLFGGFNGTTYRQDTWEWDGSTNPGTWTNRTQTAPPAPRIYHAMTWDSARSRVLVYGGTSGPDYYELWEWDGSTNPGTWTNRPLALPIPAYATYAGFAYDPLRARAVLFGPSTPTTWEWDGAAGTFADRSPSGSAPGLRNAPAVAFDTRRNRVVMFGGFGPDGTVRSMYGDTWEYDGRTWFDRSPAGGPPAAPTPRSGAGMIYDPIQDRTYLYSGYGQDPIITTLDKWLDELWAWDGNAGTWTSLSNFGSPGGRAYHSMAWDPSRSVMLVFGGEANTVQLQDIWERQAFTPTAGSWTNRTPGSPPPSRAAAASAYDSIRARFVVFGGRTTGGNPLNDTWEWNGATGTWANLSGFLGQPPLRSEASMVFDPARGREVLFGGGNKLSSLTFTDLWEWDGAAWMQRTPNTLLPSPRISAAMVWDWPRARALLIGGNASAEKAVWELRNEPSLQPGIEMTTSIAGLGAAVSSITGLRVRAFCGAVYSPYLAANAGCALSGWNSGRGPGLPPGQWTALATNTASVTAGAPPNLGLPAATGFTWSAASAAEAQRYYLERDGQMAFLFKPNGQNGVASQQALVGLDYAEVRLRYTAP
jgi:hypothetical protein